MVSYYFFFRINADEMGLVCAVAVMGNPMTIKNADIGDDGMALKRLQQVFAREGKYSVSEISKDAFVASAEDLNKADLTTGQIPLVSAKPHNTAELRSYTTRMEVVGQ